jgi:hypothetical protein
MSEPRHPTKADVRQRVGARLSYALLLKLFRHQQLLVTIAIGCIRGVEPTDDRAISAEPVADFFDACPGDVCCLQQQMDVIAHQHVGVNVKPIARPVFLQPLEIVFEHPKENNGDDRAQT